MGHRYPPAINSYNINLNDKKETSPSMIEQSVPTFIKASVTQRTMDMVKKFEEFEKVNNVILQIEPIPENDIPNVTKEHFSTVLFTLKVRDGQDNTLMTIATYREPIATIYPDNTRLNLLFDKMIDALRRYHFFMDFTNLCNEQ